MCETVTHAIGCGGVKARPVPKEVTKWILVRLKKHECLSKNRFGLLKMTWHPF